MHREESETIVQFEVSTDHMKLENQNPWKAEKDRANIHFSSTSHLYLSPGLPKSFMETLLNYQMPTLPYKRKKEGRIVERLSLCMQTGAGSPVLESLLCCLGAG